MRTVLVLGLALVALAGTAATADEKNDKALKELEGTYLLIGLEGKGLKLTEDDFKKVDDAERKIVIKGDQIIAVNKGKEDPAKIKIDASKSPALIDITSTKDKKDEVNYGIYKVEKDGTLVICAIEKGDAKDRPKEFKVNEKEIIIKLQKQK